MSSIYVKNGYLTRGHYLECLADDYNVDLDRVFEMAIILGKNEDFDGLVSYVQELASE